MRDWFVFREKVSRVWSKYFLPFNVLFVTVHWKLFSMPALGNRFDLGSAWTLCMELLWSTMIPPDVANRIRKYRMDQVLCPLRDKRKVVDIICCSEQLMTQILWRSDIVLTIFIRQRHQLFVKCFIVYTFSLSLPFPVCFSFSFSQKSE